MKVILLDTVRYGISHDHYVVRFDHKVQEKFPNGKNQEDMT